MLENLLDLPLPEIAHVVRRAAFLAVFLGIAAVAVSAFVGNVLFGLGCCIGLGLGLVNFRMVTIAVARASRSKRANRRRPLAASTLGRLGMVSAVAIILLLVEAPLGFGTLVGLAVFEFVLLANVTVAMLRATKAVGGPS
jgi:hypothetical protein